MAKHIVLQGFYQLAWMFLILYGAPRYLDRYRDPNVCHYYSNPANSGLGISACCQEGLNCLQSQGGMYLPGVAGWPVDVGWCTPSLRRRAPHLHGCRLQQHRLRHRPPQARPFLQSERTRLPAL